MSVLLSVHSCVSPPPPSSDPNKGESSVPIAWVPYDTQDGHYLEINSDINYDSVKQGLRLPYVQFWEVAYRSLPDV